MQRAFEEQFHIQGKLYCHEKKINLLPVWHFNFKKKPLAWWPLLFITMSMLHIHRALMDQRLPHCACTATRETGSKACPSAVLSWSRFVLQSLCLFLQLLGYGKNYEVFFGSSICLPVTYCRLCYAQWHCLDGKATWTRKWMTAELIMKREKVR